jgi:protoporphyrinogen IX oxidase
VSGRAFRIMEWVKAVHVIAVISWMAGLLYLPRLFVYHAGAGVGSEMSATFKIMERRLYRAIMTPAMVVAWGFGLVMIFWGGAPVGAPWLLVKLGLVSVLSGFHFWLGGMVRNFAGDRNPYSPRFYRWINELPTVIMIGVVLLVIGKPGSGL